MTTRPDLCVCAKCKELKRIDTRGMCRTCYETWRKENRHLVRGDDSYIFKSCTCHPHRAHAAHGLCRSCVWERKKIEGPFSECHPHRPLYAKGLCHACYTRERRR